MARNTKTTDTKQNEDRTMDSQQQQDRKEDMLPDGYGNRVNVLKQHNADIYNSGLENWWESAENVTTECALSSSGFQCKYYFQPASIL